MKYSLPGKMPSLTPLVLYFIQGNYLHQLFNQNFFRISKHSPQQWQTCYCNLNYLNS